MAIAYDELVFDSPPTSYKDFLRAEAMGHLSFDRNWWLENLYVAAYILDNAPGVGELYSKEGRDAIFEVWKDELAPNTNVWFQGGGDLFVYMEQGEVAMAPYYADSITRAIQEGVSIGQAIPEEGTTGYLDYLMVVRGTQRRDLAEAFINFAISKEPAQRLAELNLVSVSNRFVDYPTVKGVPDYHYLDSEDKWKQVTFFDWDFISPYYEELDKRWRREILPLAGR